MTSYFARTEVVLRSGNFLTGRKDRLLALIFQWPGKDAWRDDERIHNRY